MTKRTQTKTPQEQVNIQETTQCRKHDKVTGKQRSQKNTGTQRPGSWTRTWLMHLPLFQSKASRESATSNQGEKRKTIPRPKTSANKQTHPLPKDSQEIKDTSHEPQSEMHQEGEINLLEQNEGERELDPHGL